MFLEELYNYNSKGDNMLAESMYLHTLFCWLVNTDFDIYESLIKYYEEREEYAVCDAIGRALGRISDIINDNMERAEKVHETDDMMYFTHNEHMRIKSLIFQDILKEIYEKQITKCKENN